MESAQPLTDRTTGPAGRPDELASRFHGIDDPARLARVGTHIIDCADGAALLGRIP